MPSIRPRRASGVLVRYVWEPRGGSGRNVTFPARQYSINGERRSFELVGIQQRLSQVFKSLWTGSPETITIALLILIESESSPNDVIAPRLSVAVRRHMDRLPYGLSSDRP